MSAVILDHGIKPQQWGFDPGLTAPEWDWFWDSARCVFPMWEGAVPPSFFGSLPGVATVTAGTPSFVGTPAGLAVDFSLAGVDDSMEFFSSQIVIPSNVTEATVFVYVEFDNEILDQRLFSFFNGNSTKLSILCGRTNNKVSCFGRTSGGGLIQIDASVSYSAGDRGMIVATVREGDLRLFFAGQQVGSDGTVAVSDTLQNMNGDSSLSGTNLAELTFDGRIITAGVALRAWTPTQVAQHALDPFGPFRMEEDVEWLAIAAAAVQTVADYRYRHRYFG